MHRRVLGRITASLTGGFLGSLLLAGAASAALPPAGTAQVFASDYDCYRNNLGLCVWSTTTYFDATWRASKGHSEGQSYWQIWDIDMSAIVQDGKLCKVGTNNCTGWTFTATATFVNSSGSQVGKIWVSNYPDSCFDHAYGTYSRFFSGCKRYVTDIPISATQVKFHWAVSTKCGTCNLQTPWVADKTVPLAVTT